MNFFKTDLFFTLTLQGSCIVEILCLKAHKICQDFSLTLRMPSGTQVSKGCVALLCSG